MNAVSLDTSGGPLVARWRALRRVLLSGPGPILILAAATLAAHGRGIGDGLFLDDHLHILRYASPDWSPGHLLDASTIAPDEFIDAWWEDPTIRWQYARPFSIFLAKAVYHLSGGSVKALHALSVGLHLAGTVMIYYLCRLLTRRAGWSLVGGLLFVVHSHSIYAVGWLAAQNSVLQTVLTLAALLCYLRASRLDVYAGTREALSLTAAPSLRKGSFLLGLIFWVLALFSRENALVFPAFALAFDLAFGGRAHVRRRLPAYALMALVVVAFVFWRLKLFYVPMPAFYVRRYDGPVYFSWLLVKLLHYVTGVVWLSPLLVGPAARIDPLREVPGDCLLMAGILGVMATGYFLACRRARGWWIWPAWIVLSLLPVVPVFPAPHSAYMPAVGYAVAMILGPALRHEVRPVSIGRWSPGIAIWFLIATTTYMPIYRPLWVAVQTAEKLTVAQMAADPPPAATTDVFLINVPFVNVYTRLHLAEELPRVAGDDVLRPAPFHIDPALAWGASPGPDAPPGDFRCHVLTYAPNVLRMEEGCRLEQVDAHTFRLSADGQGYFAGALGRFFMEAMHPAGRLRTGQVVRRSLFDVSVLRADEEGVKELQFKFHEPLAHPRYCFYLGTKRQAAVRVHFWGPERFPARPPASVGDVTLADVRAAAKRLNAGEVQAGEVLLAAVGSKSPQIQAAAMTEFRPIAMEVGSALASPIVEVLERPVWNEEDRALIGQWWRDSVRGGNLRVSWVRRGDWRPWQQKRDRLFGIQHTASRIIRTDLYMTGPPYPGPR